MSAPADVAPGLGHAAECCGYLRATLAQHSKSFALAARLLPPEQPRDDAAVVYACCRVPTTPSTSAADAQPARACRAAIARLELRLPRRGAASDPVLRALPGARAAAALAARNTRSELLAGMAMDVRWRRAIKASTICCSIATAWPASSGLMMCHVLGVRDTRALRHAAHLGIAMQLTNICRDVAEDWQRGRLVPAAAAAARHGAAMR